MAVVTALLACLVALSSLPCAAWKPLRGSGYHHPYSAAMNAADTLPAVSPHRVASLAPLERRSAMHETAGRLLDEYVSKAENSPCWKSAVTELRQSCTQLLEREDQRKWLALAFTQCQLRSDNRWPADLNHCNSIHADGAGPIVQGCVEALPKDVYAIFVGYSAHIDTLCFHLQDHMFTQQLQHSVVSLRDASSEARNRLDDLAHRTDSIRDGISTVSEHQRATLEHTSGLASSLERLKSEGREAQLLLEAKAVSIKAIASDVGTIRESQETMMRQQAKRADALLVASKQQEAVLQGIVESTADIQAKALALSRAQTEALTSVDVLKQDMTVIRRDQTSAVAAGSAILAQLTKLADDANDRLQRQLATIDDISAKTNAIAAAAHDHQRSLTQTSVDLTSSMDALRQAQQLIGFYLLSVEAVGYYAIVGAGIILVTMSARLQSARLGALLVGPILSFLVERFLPHWVTFARLVWRRLAEDLGTAYGARWRVSSVLDADVHQEEALPALAASIWSFAVENFFLVLQFAVWDVLPCVWSAAGSLSLRDAAVYASSSLKEMSEAQSAIRGATLFLAGVVLVYRAATYESPDARTRRVVQEEVQRVFQESGLVAFLAAFQPHNGSAFATPIALGDRSSDSDMASAVDLINADDDDVDESFTWVNPAVASASSDPNPPTSADGGPSGSPPTTTPRASITH